MLTIGGIGGLAVGLAGREILENLFTGLIILSSSPFEVGGGYVQRCSICVYCHVYVLLYVCIVICVYCYMCVEIGVSTCLHCC